MAHLIAANDILEMKVFCREGTQTGINVLHYFVSGVAGGSLTDQQVVDSLSTSWSTLWTTMMSSLANYDGLRVQKIKPAPVTVPVVSVNGAGPGLVGALNAPPQASILLSKRTNLAGRANRGRLYIPFISDQYVGAAGGVTAGGIAAATTLSTNVFATLNVAVGGDSVTLQPIIYNRVTGTSVFMTNVLIRGFFATQRRRSLINRGDQIGP